MIRWLKRWWNETPLEREFREMFARKQIEAQIAELQGRLAALGGGK